MVIVQLQKSLSMIVMHRVEMNQCLSFILSEVNSKVNVIT